MKRWRRQRGRTGGGGGGGRGTRLFAERKCGPFWLMLGCCWGAARGGRRAAAATSREKGGGRDRASECADAHSPGSQREGRGQRCRRSWWWSRAEGTIGCGREFAPRDHVPGKFRRRVVTRAPSLSPTLRHQQCLCGSQCEIYGIYVHNLRS